MFFIFVFRISFVSVLSLVKINFCYLQGGFFIKKVYFLENADTMRERESEKENIISPWVEYKKYPQKCSGVGWKKSEA